MEDNGILGFTIDQASKVTGLSEKRLRYWDTTGFFSPQYADDGRHRRRFERVYSFRDLVGLRVLAELRDKYRIPLQRLRGFDRWLRDNYATPWSSLQFFVAGKHVIFEDPHASTLVSDRPRGQMMMAMDFERVVGEVQATVDRMRQRTPEQIGQITRRRNIMRNAYVLSGTRILTESVWSLHRDGYDKESIKRQYPTLTDEDIDAAIQFEEKRHSERLAS